MGVVEIADYYACSGGVHVLAPIGMVVEASSDGRYTNSVLELDGGVLDGRHPFDGLPFSPVVLLAISCGARLPFRRCLLWAGTRLRCVVASHRRFGRREPTAKSFCALITSGPAPAAPAGRDGRGKANPPGLGRARERSEESSRENLFPVQRQMLPQSAGVEPASTSLAVLFFAHLYCSPRVAEAAAEAVRAAFSVRGASS